MITQGLGTTSTTHDLFTDDSSVTDSDENVAVIVACIVVVVMFVVVVVVVVVFRRTHLWRRLRLYLSVVCLKYSGPKLPNVATYGIDNLSFPGEIKDDCTYDEIDDQTLEKADTPHKAGTLVRPPMKLPIKKCESSDGYLVPVSARKPDVSDLKGPEASGIYIEILDGDDVVTDITDKPDEEGSSVDVSMRVADKECDTEEPTGDYRAFTDVRSSGTLGRPPMKLHIRKCESSGGYFVPVSARKPDGDDVVTDVTNKPDDEGSSVDISMRAADKDCDTEEPTGSYKAFTDVKSTGVQPSASTPSDECLDITQVGSASEYLDLDTPGNIM